MAFMKPLVNPVWRQDALLNAARESVYSAQEEDLWLAPTETQQVEAALKSAELNRKSRRGGWSGPFAASAICHLLAIAIMAGLLARSPSISWRVARGNPNAQDAASSAPGSVGSDAATPDRTGPTIFPKAPSPPAVSPSAVDLSLDDSTALPNRPNLLIVEAVDPVIGIGGAADGGASKITPHFASARLRFSSPLSKSEAAQAGGGVSTPPRIAGPRGQRDGFDSRGLPIPEYPPESQRRGEQGLVIIDVEVLPDGRVGAIRVADDAGYPRLVSAAAEKVKLASFEPARINGRPAVAHIRIPYRFTLQ